MFIQRDTRQEMVKQIYNRTKKVKNIAHLLKQAEVPLPRTSLFEFDLALQYQYGIRLDVLKLVELYLLLKEEAKPQEVRVPRKKRMFTGV